MGVIGIILIALGILGACFFFFLFNTTVAVPNFDGFGGGYVNNIGLMADRQDGILFSFGMAIIGCFLFFIDRSHSNRQPITDNQKKGLLYGGGGVAVAGLLFVVLLAVLGSHVKSTVGDSDADTSLSSSEMNDVDTDKHHIEQEAAAIIYYLGHNNYTMPDMTSPDSLKAALTPFLHQREVGGEEIFAQCNNAIPFQPNPFLSRSKIFDLNNAGSDIVELYQQTPYSDGSRSVVFSDEQYKRISGDDWPALKQQSHIP